MRTKEFIGHGFTNVQREKYSIFILMKNLHLKHPNVYICCTYICPDKN